MSLVEKCLFAIRSRDPEQIRIGIRIAASFFELSQGRTEGLDREEVLGQPATQKELNELRDALVDLVEARKVPLESAGAVFALGKLHDPELQNFFVEILRANVRADATVLYQSMIALDNLGIGVFGSSSANSVTAEETNRVLAADFLSRLQSRQ